jgi:hypothetical protein
MSDNTTMEYRGFKAQIMEAPRLEGEKIHGLPPGTALPVYYADQFKTWPDGWMRGAGVFLVPVKPNKGLWFDWTGNDQINTAVVPTVKGCNPITGMPTSGFFLEKYEHKCPKHGCEFLKDRYCPECDYKWPDRNYQSMDPLWLDGYRTGDKVRQFFFTEDELRDVSSHLIGKENTVPAFGFAFFSTKEKRQQVINNWTIWNHSPKLYFGTMCDHFTYTNTSGTSMKGMTVGSKRNTSIGHSDPKYLYPDGGSDNIISTNCFHMNAPDMSVSNSARGELMASFVGEAHSEPVKEQQIRVSAPLKDVSIGAGAQIQQDLNEDSYAIDTWKDKPDSVMTIYFVFQDEFERIKAGGYRSLEGKKEGMLEGITVG